MQCLAPCCGPGRRQRGYHCVQQPPPRQPPPQQQQPEPQHDQQPGPPQQQPEPQHDQQPPLPQQQPPSQLERQVQTYLCMVKQRPEKRLFIETPQLGQRLTMVMPLYLFDSDGAVRALHDYRMAHVYPVRAQCRDGAKLVMLCNCVEMAETVSSFTDRPFIQRELQGTCWAGACWDLGWGGQATGVELGSCSYAVSHSLFLDPPPCRG